MCANKVLVVDDNPTDLANIKGIVSDAGCKVITATNGKDAIVVAKSEQPDVIFLDIIMPEMDGYETCRMLNSDAETKDIPVIFVSSKDQKADIMWAKMQGGRAYITKPVNSDELMDQLRAV